MVTFRKVLLIILSMILLLCTLPVGAHAVNLDTDYVEAVGIGVPPANFVNTPRGTALARRAAIVDAQRNLAEIVQGVHIDAQTTVKDLMLENDSIKSKLAVIIKGARIQSERTLPDGSYEVVLKVSVHGVGGLESIRPNPGNDFEPSPQPLLAPQSIAPVSPTLPQDNVITPFGQTRKVSGQELTGKIYYLPEDTSELPDFSRLSPVGEIYANILDIEPRSFDQGFPGVTNRFEWFGVVYTGSFSINQPGSYVFTTYSDDGTKVYIDGQLVVNNDGIHPPCEVEEQINLTPGNHSIRVEYFQGPRYEIALQLFITPPGSTKKLFNVSDYPPNTSKDKTFI